MPKYCTSFLKAIYCFKPAMLALFLLAVLSVNMLPAQNNLNNAGLVATTARAAYSLRKLSTAYTGFAVNVRRSSDNAQANIAFDATGKVSATSVATMTVAGTSGLTVGSTLAFGSFYAATNCLVTTWYDQSGYGNHTTQSTTGNQPLIVTAGVFNLLNGRPALKFDGAVTWMNVPFASSLINAQGSIATVHSQPVLQNNFHAIFAWEGGTSSVGYGPLNAAGKFGLYTTSGPNNLTMGTVTANTVYVANATWTGNGSAITESRNGTIFTGSFAQLFTVSANTGWLGQDGVVFNGSLPEAIVFSTALATADRQSLEANQTAYYNAPNADLSALATTAGTIAPSFAAATTAYTASVGNATTSVTVTPTVADATATVTVNGTVVSSGSASGAVALTVGTNTITVLVTAQDGTTTKSYTITVTRLTQPGNALSFDGTNDYVDFSSSITNLNKANFTLETWVKTTSVSCGIVNCSNGNTSWEPGEKVFYLNSLGQPAFVGWGNEYINSNQAVNDGTWHHIAVVWAYSGSGTSGTPKIYVDGADRTAASNYAANNDNLGTFKLGMPNYFSGEAPNFFAGSMDEVRIWNTARSQSQIQANINTELAGNEAGLAAYYKLNQATAAGTNTGWSLGFDATSNNYYGALNNFALSGATSNWVTGIVPSATATTNADLTALTTTAGTLAPTFAAATTAYTASVTNATTSVTVTPTKSDANANVQVRVNAGSYTTLASGTASAALGLNVGANTIDVKVTAQDGTTTKTYTITVTRAAVPPGNALNFDGTDDYVTTSSYVVPVSGDFNINSICPNV